MRDFELFSEVMKKHANGCSISIGNRIKLQDFWSKAEKVETMSRHIYFTKPLSYSAIQKPHKKKKDGYGHHSDIHPRKSLFTDYLYTDYLFWLQQNKFSWQGYKEENYKN